MLVDASSVEIPSESYARIRNPRLLIMVRGILITLFVFLTVDGLVSLPSSYEQTHQSIVSDAPTLSYLNNLGISVDVATGYNFFLTLAECLVFTAAGLLIFAYRSDDFVAILLASILVGNGIASFGYDVHTGPSITNLFVLVHPILANLPIFPLLCLFPDGRFVPHWSRWLLPLFVVLSMMLIYVHYLFYAYNMTTLTSLSSILGLLVVLFWCLGILFLLLRLRRTDNISQRQQIKQMFTGMAVVIATGVISIMLQFVPILGRSALGNIVLLPLFSNGGQLFFVIMLTFSILRYRLWEIDLVLNRGVVYVSLVIVLGLVFLGILIVLDTGLQAVLGSQQTILATMVSTGTVVGLFNPVRLRLQRLADRQLFGLRVNLNPIGGGKHNSIDQAQLALTGLTNLTSKQLGAYQIDTLIGRGGMGEVYLGTQSALKRRVAIKVMLPDLSGNLEFRSRFEREARIVANLHHPNIISIFDFGEIGGSYYMVMEYIEGPDLGVFLRGGKVLSFTETIPLITQVANALDYAHAQGVIHRDIKPSNIMLKHPTDSPKHTHPILMDFGLTKLADSNSGLTQSGPLGTLAYMAPEQITAAREADHRADIYALGVMCYQMLTGKLPFSSNSQAALLFAHLHKPAPDPRLLRPELPSQAASAMLRALDKEPTNRPQSAGGFAAELLSSA